MFAKVIRKSVPQQSLRQEAHPCDVRGKHLGNFGADRRDHRHGTGLHGINDESTTIRLGPGARKEHRSGLDASRVLAQVPDVGIIRIDSTHIEPGKQRREFHVLISSKALRRIRKCETARFNRN